MIRSLGEILFSGNVAIPLIALGLTLPTFGVFGFPPDAPILLLVGAGAFLFYQLDATRGSYARVPSRGNSAGWRDRHRGFIFFSVIASSVIVVALMTVQLHDLRVLSAAVGVIGLAYLFPLVPWVGPLRRVWFLKPICIAAVWSTGTVALPVVAAGVPVAVASFAGLLTYRFLFLLPNALLCDLPDVRDDAASGVPTVARRFGERRVFVAARILIAVLALVLVAAWRQGLPAGWVLTESVGLLLISLAVVPVVDYRTEEFRWLADGALLWFAFAPVVWPLLGF